DDKPCACRPAFAYMSERSSRFAKDFLSIDPASPDARCAVNLDPLGGGTTIGTGERPGHFPYSGRTHDSLDPQIPRAMYPRVRDDVLSNKREDA
ncbi:MAG: hypothetical protein WBR33_20995, partial [Pseudonocardiaceae bacterium]